MATINAANPGFTSRLNSEIGSLLIYKMYTKYMKALQYRSRRIAWPMPFLHEVMDEIQTELQDEGKQLPVATYNDDTRYLTFCVKGDRGTEGNDGEDEKEDAAKIDNDEQMLDETIGVKDIDENGDASKGIAQNDPQIIFDDTSADIIEKIIFDDAENGANIQSTTSFEVQTTNQNEMKIQK